MVSAMKILENAFARLALWGGRVRKPVSCTHLVELVKKGVVVQKDASPTCSASQTLTDAPVPQVGRACSAMKHATLVTMGQTAS